jgi:predicted metalloprotease with PDZ domain
MPPAAPIAAPIDQPYPGVIKLTVDATDLPRALFSVHETIPVATGPLTLLYPRWLPGKHSPQGPVESLTGLMVRAGGKLLAWRRDPVEMGGYHVDVPAGVTSLDIDFQFVSPVSTKEGRIVMTPDMLNIQWNAVALYPAGYFTRQIKIEPSVRLPEGFKLATALETANVHGQTTQFRAVDFETFVDSPLIAGRNFKSYDLTGGSGSRVTLDVIADRPEQVIASEEQLKPHLALVTQADKLFGSRHYAHYDFLFSLSDKMGGIGLEHMQSSEDGTMPGYFTEWERNVASRELLSHEYTHSWNGKFRRPADLWTPTYNTPMRDSLLWVYEGQTQYWGWVLWARSGLANKQQGLDSIAMTAATYDARAGRAWRAMEDTVNDPIINMRRPLSWRSWQRAEDYYSEGQLIWLDVDTLLREKTNGAKSLDDFARGFFGVDNGSMVIHTYNFDDVVAQLNAVYPYDWASFLHQRLEGHGPGAPLDGLARGGYKLVYDEKPSDFGKSVESARKITDLLYSIGVIIGKDGALSEVLWEGPAFKAGLTEGTQLVAVNGDAYDADLLKAAIRNAKGNGPAIELLVKDKDRYRTVKIEYHDGLRYPKLERIADKPAYLDAILEAKP